MLPGRPPSQAKDFFMLGVFCLYCAVQYVCAVQDERSATGDGDQLVPGIQAVRMQLWQRYPFWRSPEAVLGRFSMQQLRAHFFL